MLEVCFVRDAPLLIQLLHHQFQRIDVRGVETLIDPEDIPQEGDVLR